MTPFRLAGRPLAVLAALVLSLLSACQREKDAAPTASQPLSIEEARSWFDSHLGASPSGSPSGRTAKKPAREPNWPYAYKQKVKDKELVMVPLSRDQNPPKRRGRQ
jgi:nitrous oxide reductase accessory protein NosL